MSETEAGNEFTTVAATPLELKHIENAIYHAFRVKSLSDEDLEILANWSEYHWELFDGEYTLLFSDAEREAFSRIGVRVTPLKRFRDWGELDISK